jgi:serine/threonine protein kinase
MIYYGKGKLQYDLPDRPIAAGGEGEIYNINGKNNLVAKIYKPNKLNPEKERKLVKMIDYPPEAGVLTQIAWPRDVLYSNGNFVGFVMPKMAINEDLNVMYEPPSSSKYPDLTWESRIIIAENLCVVLDGIHNSGYVCGDLNPKNISVNPLDGHVVFLDTDSYHIQDGANTYRCDVGITEYLPAEVQRKMRGGSTLATANLPTFSQDTDNFALAIHIFQLVMNGCHPFACAIIPSHSSVTAPQPSDNIEKGTFPFMQSIPGIKIPVYAPPISILPQNIQGLFKRAFIDGHGKPSARPKAAEWHKVLDNLRQNLKTCNKVAHHQYHNSLSSCPWCDADKAFSNSLKTTSAVLQQISIKPPASATQARQATQKTYTSIIPPPPPIPQMPMYTVTFDSNDGSGNKHQMSVPAGLDLKNLPDFSLKRSGYDFEFWNTQPNGTGRNYRVGDKYSPASIHSGDVTLYARWEKIENIVSFNHSGGSGNTNAMSVQPGSSLILPDCNGVKKGYRFNGWNTKADGTGTNYQPGSKFTPSIRKDVLYAEWVETLQGKIERKARIAVRIAVPVLLVGAIIGAVSIYISINGDKSGLTWTAAADSGMWDYRNRTRKYSIEAIAYGVTPDGTGRFVVGGESGKMAYSVDGVIWTAVADSTFPATYTEGGIYPINAIAFGNNKFVAGGGEGIMAYSSDGVTWTAVADSTFPARDSKGIVINISSIVYGNDRFVAVGGGGKIAYSTDGIKWTAVTDSGFGENSITAIAYGDGKFVAGGYAGRMAYSEDGITWTRVSNSTFPGSVTTGGLGFALYITAIAYSNGKFVAGGDEQSRMAYSDDGITWTAVADSKFGRDRSITALAYGDGKFFAGGDDGKMAYSTDGIKWTAVKSNFGRSRIKAIAYGNDMFVAVGNSGKIVYATKSIQTTTAQQQSSGMTWTAVANSKTWEYIGYTSANSKDTAIINGIAYGNGKFVAGGGFGKMAYSTDGVTWTAVEESTFPDKVSTYNEYWGTLILSVSVSAFAYGDGRFVAVGEDGRMAYSTDGITWTAVRDSTFGGSSINAIDYGGGRFIAVGQQGEIAFSTDGVSWTNAGTNILGTYTSRGHTYGNDAKSITYGEGRFVAVGDRGAMAYSADGRNWTAVPNSGFGETYINAIAYGIAPDGAGRFVAGGYEGRIAYSTDGITWIAVDSKFGNNNINAITYGNGRFTAVGNNGKIAYSSDGTTWIAVSNSRFGNSDIYDISYGNNKFVAVSYGKMAYSNW